jgi:hypothetical protein
MEHPDPILVCVTMATLALFAAEITLFAVYSAVAQGERQVGLARLLVMGVSVQRWNEQASAAWPTGPPAG